MFIAERKAVTNFYEMRFYWFYSHDWITSEIYVVNMSVCGPWGLLIIRDGGCPRLTTDYIPWLRVSNMRGAKTVVFAAFPYLTNFSRFWLRKTPKQNFVSLTTASRHQLHEYQYL